MSREKIKDYERKGNETSSDYEGYHSVNLGDSYDDITQQVKDCISSHNGVLDPRTETYGGNRATFHSEKDRDAFNKALEDKKKKNKQQNNKKDTDFGKAKTQKELDKMKESRINRVVLSEIKRFFKNNIIKN